MEKKSEPKRALICILSALLGGMLSILLVLIRHYAFTKKNLIIFYFCLLKNYLDTLDYVEILKANSKFVIAPNNIRL